MLNLEKEELKITDLKIEKDSLNKDSKIKTKFRKTETFSFISNQFTVIMIISIILQINLLVMQLFFSKSSLILNIMVIAIPIMIYLIFKDIRKNKGKNATIYFKIMVINLGLMVLNHMLINLFITLTKSNGPFPILFIFNIGLIIAFIGFYSQEGSKEFFEAIEKQNFSEKILEDGDNELKVGDIIIGYQADTETDELILPKKPVVIPLKDRFLHMLILGPTGCGKTSQVIIPMVNKDLENEDLGVIVIEPKGDLAEKVYAMAKYHNREVLYFNPILADCPYFNPLHGRESDVIENMATTFNMLNPGANQYFKDMTDGLIRKSITVLKRLYGNDATLIDLNTLVWDINGEGRKMVMALSRLTTPRVDIQKENNEVIDWFLKDYYSGMSGARGGSKTYEHCSGARSQITKLVSNKYLRKVLNPPKGKQSDIDFDDALKRKVIITITTAQGALRDLGRFLGFFIILQLQASVFRRPGNDSTREHCMLYIDEFQVYANPGFIDMLTMGRSYRVASHLATQARDQIGMGAGADGKAFIQSVSTNARNKIIFPGISFQDAKYYSEEFGEIMTTTKNKSYSKKRFLSTMNDESVSTSVKEAMEQRFSPSRLIYKEFGKATYCIIKGNSVQPPDVAQMEFIPKDLNDLLDKMVKDYNEIQFNKDIESEKLLNESTDRNSFNKMSVIPESVVVKPITSDGNFIDPISITTSQIVDKEFSYTNNNDEFFDSSPIVTSPKTAPIVGDDLLIAEEFDDLI